MIECTSIYGNKKMVQKRELTFRPSVYGIIINDGKILMVNSKSNNKLFFPGGGIEIGETIEQALKREVKEETGLEIEIKNFLHHMERFFYYDPEKLAFHAFLFFHTCKPLTFDLVDDDQVDDDEAEKPRWYDLTELKKDKSGKIDELVRKVLLLV